MTAPKSAEHEWLFRVGDYAIRDITDGEREAERRPVWDDYSIVVHIPTGERLGEDGGEPEDQTLLRDWSWIPHALDAAEKRGREAAAKDAAELERLREENKRLRGLAKDLTLDAVDRIGRRHGELLVGDKLAKLLAVATAAKGLREMANLTDRGTLIIEGSGPVDAIRKTLLALDALEGSDQ